MDVLYIAALYHLNISTQLTEDIRVSKSDLFITTDRNKVARFLSDPTTRAAIGILEYESLVSGLPVIYCQRKAGGFDEIKTGVIEFLRDIVSFCTTVWTGRDNSINSEFAFGITEVGGRPAIHSNYNAVRHCMADGKEAETKLTKRELASYLDSLFPLVERETYQAEKMRINLVGKVNRMERFMFHIQIARRDKELALKINSYCIAFEALLSTSNSELAHQLAERIALLTANDKKSRIEIYKLIKRAYSIRSSVAHGGNIKETPEKLESMAKEIDQIARWLYVGAISDDEVHQIIEESDPEKINDFFIDKIFQGTDSSEK